MAARPNMPVHDRPRSPHLFSGFFALNYRWGPHMLVSILHRVTGDGMATVGTLLLVWWLTALAGGPESYAAFRDVFTTASGALNIVGWVVGVGLTLALFQHIMSGIRHLVMDTGAAFELRTNKRFAVLTMVCSVTLTLAFWLYMGFK
jgi:succinate dehydrogenase / fumarate reductase cytochrome b subunit